MPKITKITYQKKNTEKVNLFVDDKFLTGIDYITWIQYGFKIGDEITNNQIEKLKKQNQIDKAYAKALKLLSLRPQSSLEIKQKLTKSFDQTIIEQIIDKLKRNNLIDDKEFAKIWIKERLKTRLRSKQHLIAELRQKGIDRSIIAEMINLPEINQNEIEAATKLIIKKLRQEKTIVVSNKIKTYLMRKGFNYKTILEAEEKIKDLKDELVFADQTP